ncbi:type II toxin-antitoxin system RelE/ParE family toxin [Pararhizobium sp.]|uniref:type II toxin-antitoxin system RelE/ParE family toxin n=1 Tax=Pararhizobium sp. TaxID=1977563 RepID=UPI00271E5DAD|nr:type II toxin-antitoxin system RelE/ParE family toxin [Pararhizobium sp.]MDO9414831.1 type II toxin-antitoxin system RelE/ParE family toxin [Pararhizobium sp.]
MKPVVWSDDARRDYLDILRHIAQDDWVAAEKVVDAIEKAGNSLGNVPTGRPGRISGTYEKSVSRLPYVISYAIGMQAGHETIYILRVIHTARNWPSGAWPE